MAKQEEKQFKKISYTSSIIFIVIGLLIIGSLSWLVVSKIINITGSIQEQKSHIAQLDRRDQDYQKLQSDFEKIKDDYQLIDKALPDQTNFVDFITYIEKKSKQENVRVIIDFPDEPEVKNNMLEFNIKILGKQKDVIKYLKGVIASNYHIQIPSLKINHSGSEKSVAELTLKVGVDETFSPNQVSN